MSNVDSEDARSISLRVPRQTAVAIHYPGYVRNTDLALQTLGGPATLNKALQDEASFVKLRYRPEDQHSHPLFGERQKENGLLLRISRPRDQPDADPTITIAARVTASYSFAGLADYQYLGVDTYQQQRDYSNLTQRNRPEAAEPFKAAQPLMLVPPIFSKLLYLRCGFDPRLDPDSRRYQLLSYRLPMAWSKRVKAAKQAGRPMQQPLISQLSRWD
eukprot:gene13848-13969_t